ncbi:MAG: glycosyltransferase family 1 protein [Thermodesulfobacteriota bacterium]|jgi:glycosyltransferase involved in cell wall biosynthesis
MKIAINTIPLLSPLTGVGHYTYQIAKVLQEIDSTHEYSYFYGYYSPNLISPGEHPKNFYRLKEAVRKVPFLGTAVRNLKDWPNYLSSRRFDLYFEPNFIPLKMPAKRTVVTVLDFSFARFPQWHSKDKIHYFQKHFWKKISRADRIIVISDFIREEAIHLFGFSPERVTTIPLGFDPKIFKVYSPKEIDSVRKKYSLPDKFILSVGSIEPRKNLRNLLRAYQELGGSIRREYKIVLVGFKGWENKEIMKMIQSLEGDVYYPGYVPEDDLGKFYNLAHLFAYPSFYEGFGLPPLEAMACGCPVIVSNTSSLPEVCGDAALYVNPHDITSIREGMERLLTDDPFRKQLTLKGFERASRFGWEKSAKEHLKLFEEICPSF